MTKTLSGLLLGSAMILVGTPVLAQQKPATAPSRSMFERTRNVSVSQRPHPGYDPMPIPMGGFTGLPKLDVGVQSDDNIYASNVGKKSDTIFTINPEFDLASRWSRNALQAYARAASKQYSKFTAESTTDWQLGATGRLDIGNGNLNAGGDTGEFTEPRVSPNTATAFQSVKPVRYAQSNAFFGGTEELNRVRLSARYDYSNYDYRNATRPTGGVFLEDDRDHTLSTVSGKAEYAVSPDTAVFFDAAYNEHRYRLTPAGFASKNSKGDTVTVGANFDLSHVARGEVEVGYLKQDFTSNKVASYSGLSAKALVEWFPTQLTTITLSGSRALQDAAAIGSPVYVAEAVALQGDHELLRNLILTGHIGTETDTYKGVDRKDTSTTGSLGAKYLINRMVGVTLAYQYQKQDSTGAAKAPAYTDNRLVASTSLAF